MICKLTKLFGWVHLTIYSVISLLLAISLIMILFFSTNEELMESLFNLNNEQSQLGTLLYVFSWFWVVIVGSTLVFVLIYLIINIIFFIKLYKGNISLVIMIINLLIALNMLTDHIKSLFMFHPEEYRISFLIINWIIIFASLSGVLYSFFALFYRITLIKCKKL
ncbi:MAG: hypothetical protein K0Q49_1869 [Haloplasmataceae bacterium]|nr:hypothetical protein [Haloplasmataceae bacterium]